MTLQNKIVIELAQPILGSKRTARGWEYYVKHWEISGYSWDGECMCSKEKFTKVQLNITNLSVSIVEIVKLLKSFKNN